MTPLLPPNVDLAVVAPAGIVLLAALVLMVLAPLLPRRVELLAAVALVGLGLALVAQLALWGGSRATFGGTLVADELAVFLGAIAIAAAAFAVLVAVSFLRQSDLPAGEYLALVLLSTVGAVVLVGARDLVVALIGLEILSLAFYVLAGFERDRKKSQEAALKYFLLGAFAFGFLVYGTALLFGATGATGFAAIGAALAQGAPSTLALVGAALLLVGIAFKLGFVPFQMWAPDVYEGAPTPAAGFLAVGAKVAGFGVLLRFLVEALPALRPQYVPVLAAIAILTMIVGNLGAIVQRDVKRMLAYSSIGQAGYVLVALVAADVLGLSGVLFYVAAYAAMNLGAFGVVAAVAGAGDDRTSLADYAGLGRRSPWLAAALGLFLLSLAGIPPTAGFVGKLAVFGAAIAGGFGYLAIVGALTSVAATFFYVAVIARMYMQPSAEGALKVGRVAPALAVGLAVAAFFTLQLGLLPGLSLEAARAGVLALAGR